ncbi:3-phosphoserine/phosphohydroxythreonine transaminase [Marinobacter sp. NP-4(2019)]|uniref:3-phosphoserine/phosphohydroxythreonine transaminase n=1 Tax=Marinobacter sp. NP-4(2019) TaxID=2488665 RepID=UPI000FC3E269|nr:3-phosphoserine/phosphohydroxythreonine transaminase [Marinobacter sp. NP-4(2019)]AZT85004.1 3-phosphoserine/phosphohydroxythreonine transaminase [Marinobacter sp. NP-4(2019)]
MGCTGQTYNFAAGPATLPPEVLERARASLVDWQGLGYSLLEAPFTGDEFKALVDTTRHQVKATLAVPDHYQVVFLQGGASAQFSLVPLNLLPPTATAGYVETGHWSARAIEEGRRYGRIQVVASTRGSGFDRVPTSSEWALDENLHYCHITPNETANGVQFPGDPDCGDTPLIADMTSEFLSRPVEIERYGMIYAGAQKNLGPTGLVIAIIREDLLGQARPETPTVFNYQAQIERQNRINTPLMFGIYLVHLMLDWLEEQGGVKAIQTRNIAQSQTIYRIIDQDDFFYCPVTPEYRSIMNVCFGIRDQRQQQRFLSEAHASGLANLAGHSHAGGLRASLYNAQPDAAVAALASFMNQFRQRHG